MKKKSLFVQITIILVVAIIFFSFFISQSQRKYEILDIQSDQNSDALPVILFFNFLSLLLLAISWWQIIYGKKKGLTIIALLTIIELFLIIYWSIHKN